MFANLKRAKKGRVGYKKRAVALPLSHGSPCPHYCMSQDPKIGTRAGPFLRRVHRNDPPVLSWPELVIG